MTEPANKATVLVVDDDELCRQLVEIILKNKGYRVLSVADAEKALALAAEGGKVDVLLTDLDMGGMRGDALANQFIALYPQVSVILTSGSNETLNLSRSIQFLSKPYTPSELVETIERGIARGLLPR